MHVTKYLDQLKRTGLAIVFTCLALALVAGCQGPSSPSSPAGSSPAGSAPSGGAVTGKIAGKTTNSLTGSGVAGVAVTTDPAIKGITITTDVSGAYSAELPIGVYNIAYKKDGYTAANQTVSLVAGQTATRDIVLKPTAPVLVKPGNAQAADPGATVTLKATAEPLDGSTVKSYEWTQISGVPAAMDNPKADTVKVTLDKAPAYKAAIIKGLENLDRFMVQGINPHALDTAVATTFKVNVTTSSGTYSGTVTVTAKLPYAFTTGLQDVPAGVPALLHGKNQKAYNWTIAGPAGSKAELDDATSQNPMFIPDFNGKYVLTEKNSNATLSVYAGTWEGTITGQNDKGRPLAAGCTTCHNGTIAADKFTPWMNSGHSEIFTQNINDPAGHWSEACAVCHTVGYNVAVKNNGFDEAMTAEGWKVPSHGDVGLWTQILATYPKTAKLANIQCENCHGPNQDSGLHENGVVDAARVSIAAGVCGSCHGEPLRHGRFQQWEESGHSNFELALDEATVEGRAATAAHCGRCHSGQGFLAWIKQGDLTKQIQGKSGNATVAELTAMGLTKDKVEPQTCVVCHDPHEQGTTSGEPTTAKVRITDNTALLAAGFKAERVGKGAICMTCHNTRSGLHNNEFVVNTYSAPHTAAQTDVLMGENAYLVDVGSRSPHSFLQDTCVTCHMEKSPPPEEFSFQQSGTNHSFKADPTICSSCHAKELDAEGLQLSFEEKLVDLGKAMSSYLLKKMPARLTVLDYTPHTYNNVAYDLKSDPVVISKDNIDSIEPTEPHGQQGFLVKFKAPVSITYKPANATHTMDLKEIEVQLGDITTDGKTQIIPATDVFIKAGWNYFLLHGDGSEGIHNPDFSFDVINASLRALR